MTYRHLFGGVAISAVLAASAAMAADTDLPRTIAVTTYDVGSAGYNQSVALGSALGNAYDVSVRVLPATSDVARLLPLKQGRVSFGIIGSESFNAVEGTEAFATPEMGPQPLRLLIGSNSDNCFTLGLAGDAGIKSVADLPGKRIGWVVGSPALKSNVEAFLAFGGWTTDDVELVEVASFSASWKALINGQLDAVTTLTTVSFATQMQATPSGLTWLPLPHDDVEGWARLQATKPQFSPRVGTLGPGMSADNPLDCAGFPFPVMLAYDDHDPELVYNMTKAIDEQYDAYVDIEPAMMGWSAERQNFQWVLPYHDGAIRFWLEKGVWDDADQAHNDGLVARQALLRTAWEGMGAVSDDDVNTKWPAIRDAALEGAGLPTYSKK
ncbi:MAG: TAXI family TRAP transporter solute-binding subunit [Paracoccaceae bacterium]